jgi:uncharacterized Zn finger protein (UPF0148 family)
MAIIVAGRVFCPICEKEMQHVEVQIHKKRATLYFCRPCEIGIYDFDPAFNKWRDADKDIPCPNCGHPKMKWFVRYMDGFFKAFCPKCKTVLKKDGDVRFGKGGNIIIPEEMEDDYEPPVEVKIPLAHLLKRLGKDKINALKAKLSKKNDV